LIEAKLLPFLEFGVYFLPAQWDNPPFSFSRHAEKAENRPRAALA